MITVHHSPKLVGRLLVGGSKNYTSRYVLAATLAEGVSVLRNPADIDDARVMVTCCTRLGARIERVPDGLVVTGTGRRLLSPGELNVGNAGAVARFLMAIAATLPAPTRFTTPYPESLGRRPHHDLLQALSSLGCHCESQDGRLPIAVSGGLHRGGRVCVSGATSSQFSTALLFLAPLLSGITHIEVCGPQRSAPLLKQTLEVLQATGIEVTHQGLRNFRVTGPQSYRAGDHFIPGDWPGAAAILAAAAVVESDVVLTGLSDDAQGERAIVNVLQAMGADVVFDRAARHVRMRGGRPLRAVEFDGDQATDAVMAMVAAACFADGTSRFTNIENLRYKESDRISDYCRELAKMGAQLEETRDSITVHGNPEPLPGGVTVDAHHDHRLLMGATIVALRCKQPVRLTGAQHIAKSYPSFFTDLQRLGAYVSATCNSPTSTNQSR